MPPVGRGVGPSSGYLSACPKGDSRAKPLRRSVSANSAQHLGFFDGRG